jgi:arylsulfatase A-like enzyme
MTGDDYADRDVVVVVIDALRTDGVGHLDGVSGVTPTIDALAASGVTFPSAYSCINTTDPSLTTMETGLFPRTTGLVHHGQQVTEREAAGLSGVPVLAECLRNAGYDTAAVDWLGRWHQRGFDAYTGRDGIHDYGAHDDGDEAGPESLAGRVADAVNDHQDVLPDTLFRLLRASYRRVVGSPGDKDAVEDAETTTDRAVDLLDRMHRPRYLFVHYWDVHAPYDTPQEFASDALVPELSVDEAQVRADLDRIENDDRRRYVEEILEDGLSAALRQYYGAVSYVDAELARLLEHVPDDAYVIVVADHGESLFEHGIFFEHHGLYEVNTHVPFVVDGPDVFGDTPSGFAQLCDLMPTVLGRVGVDHPPVDGIDLCERLEAGLPLRDVAFAEEAQTQRRQMIRTSNYRYIRALDDSPCSYCGVRHGDETELYDLAADPNERANVAREHPDETARLHDRLQTVLEETTPVERVRISQTLDRVARSPRL